MTTYTEAGCPNENEAFQQFVYDGHFTYQHVDDPYRAIWLAALCAAQADENNPRLADRYGEHASKLYGYMIPDGPRWAALYNVYHAALDLFATNQWDETRFNDGLTNWFGVYPPPASWHPNRTNISPHFWTKDFLLHSFWHHVKPKLTRVTYTPAPEQPATRNQETPTTMSTAEAAASMYRAIASELQDLRYRIENITWPNGFDTDNAPSTDDIAHIESECEQIAEELEDYNENQTIWVEVPAVLRVPWDRSQRGPSDEEDIQVIVTNSTGHLYSYEDPDQHVDEAGQCSDWCSWLRNADEQNVSVQLHDCAPSGARASYSQ